MLSLAVFASLAMLLWFFGSSDLDEPGDRSLLGVRATTPPPASIAPRREDDRSH